MTEEELKKAAAVALSSAAVKAKHLATQEERKIRSLVAVLVDFQVKKMELKMKQLDELENMLDKQRDTIENQRRQVLSLFTVKGNNEFSSSLRSANSFIWNKSRFKRQHVSAKQLNERPMPRR